MSKGDKVFLGVILAGLVAFLCAMSYLSGNSAGWQEGHCDGTHGEFVCGKCLHH